MQNVFHQILLRSATKLQSNFDYIPCNYITNLKFINKRAPTWSLFNKKPKKPWIYHTFWDENPPFYHNFFGKMAFLGPKRAFLGQKMAFLGQKMAFLGQKMAFLGPKRAFLAKNGIFSAAAVLLFRLRVAVGKISYMTLKPCVYKWDSTHIQGNLICQTSFRSHSQKSS